MNAPLPVLTQEPEFDPVARIEEFIRRIQELYQLWFEARAENNLRKAHQLIIAEMRYRATIRRLSWLPQRRGLFREGTQHSTTETQHAQTV